MHHVPRKGEHAKKREEAAWLIKRKRKIKSQVAENQPIGVEVIGSKGRTEEREYRLSCGSKKNNVRKRDGDGNRNAE